VKELMYTPDTGELEARIATQLALSRMFATGGENLKQTLTSLTQAYLLWVGEMRETGSDLLLNQLSESIDSEMKDELTYEFNRLFVGPASPSVPPYESVYRSEDGLVMQESTLDVRKWYREEKLSLSSPSNEPDDFISTELEFAAYLLACALELYQKDHVAEALEYLQKYNTFWDEHLGLWLPAFVQKLSFFSRAQVFKVIGEILIQTVTPIRQGEGGLS